MDATRVGLGNKVRWFALTVAVALSLATGLASGSPDSEFAHAETQPSGHDGLPLYDEHETLERSYGYTAEETVDFLVRQPSLMLVAGELGTRYSDVVAGSYIDHERRGVLVVRATGDREQLTARIAQEWPELSGYVDVEPGHIPLSLQDPITEQLLDAFERAGVDNVLTRMDHAENVYLASVDSRDEDAAKAIVRDIASMYDIPYSALKVRPRPEGYEGLMRQLHSPCTLAPIRCNPPARGGLFLQSPTGHCSSGFMAENTAGNYYTLSAGHCGSGGYRHQTHSDGTRYLGGAPGTGVFTPEGRDLAGNPTQTSCRVDAARVFISEADATYWGKGRNVYLYSNVNYFAVTNAWSQPLQLPQLLFVHRGGGRSGTTTGFVRYPAVSFTTGGVRYCDRLLSSYSNAVGDSGSPVVVRYGERGVPAATGVALDNARLEHEGQIFAEASHVRFVEDTLQVRLRHSVRVP